MTGMVRPLKWRLLSSPINSCLLWLAFYSRDRGGEGTLSPGAEERSCCVGLYPPAGAPPSGGAALAAWSITPWPSGWYPGKCGLQPELLVWLLTRDGNQNSMSVDMVRVCVYTQGSGNK